MSNSDDDTGNAQSGGTNPSDQTAAADGSTGPANNTRHKQTRRPSTTDPSSAAAAQASAQAARKQKCGAQEAAALELLDRAQGVAESLLDFLAAAPTLEEIDTELDNLAGLRDELDNINVSALGQSRRQALQGEARDRVSQLNLPMDVLARRKDKLAAAAAVPPPLMTFSTAGTTGSTAAATSATPAGATTTTTNITTAPPASGTAARPAPPQTLVGGINLGGSRRVIPTTVPSTMVMASSSTFISGSAPGGGSILTPTQASLMALSGTTPTYVSQAVGTGGLGQPGGGGAQHLAPPNLVPHHIASGFSMSAPSGSGGAPPAIGRASWRGRVLLVGLCCEVDGSRRKK